MGLLNMHANVEMRHMECGDCGIVFWAPEAVMADRQRTGKSWYCPNGHSRVYRETDVQKLQKQLDAEKFRREQAEREAEWAKAEARNHKTQRTKAQNALKRVVTRVNAGVCPHCNRTFKQLAAHMKTKHPDVAPPAPEVCGHE